MLFRSIRGDVITRVMGEHVVGQTLFNEVWKAQLHAPKAFWTPYPFPSIAADDPTFVRPIPRNSWGGASQALTALRTPRWMEHYGQYSALTHLMMQWVESIERAGQFNQQIDPQTGNFSPDRGAYSPAMLTYYDFVKRLHGVRPLGDEIEWNCRLPKDGKVTAMRDGEWQIENAPAGSQLRRNGKTFATVKGPVRVVSTAAGKPVKLIGTEPTLVTATLHGHRYAIKPDQVLTL